MEWLLLWRRIFFWCGPDYPKITVRFFLLFQKINIYINTKTIIWVNLQCPEPHYRFQSNILRQQVSNCNKHQQNPNRNHSVVDDRQTKPWVPGDPRSGYKVPAQVWVEEVQQRWASHFTHYVFIMLLSVNGYDINVFLFCLFHTHHQILLTVTDSSFKLAFQRVVGFNYRLKSFSCVSLKPHLQIIYYFKRLNEWTVLKMTKWLMIVSF